MIVAEQKPLEEILKLVDGARSVLVLGCGTCVTVCFAGGAKEAEVLAAAMRMRSRLDDWPLEVSHGVVQRQCEWEYLDAAGPLLEGVDCVVSLGCGVGVQAVVERFPEMRTVPGLNTRFYGLPTVHGVWEARCAGCGDCVLGLTDGICPVARCSKSLLNGPCGGSQGGKCEVNPETPCAWHLIYDRMKAMGHLDRLEAIQPPKDWRPGPSGGPGRIVRPDLMRDAPARAGAEAAETTV